MAEHAANDVSSVKGKDIRGKLVTLERTTPAQLSLFQTFLPPDEDNPTTPSRFDIIAPIRYARPAYHVQLQEAADVTSVSDSRQRVCDSHL